MRKDTYTYGFYPLCHTSLAIIHSQNVKPYASLKIYLSLFNALEHQDIRMCVSEIFCFVLSSHIIFSRYVPCMTHLSSRVFSRSVHTQHEHKYVALLAPHTLSSQGVCRKTPHEVDTESCFLKLFPQRHKLLPLDFNLEKHFKTLFIVFSLYTNGLVSIRYFIFNLLTK